MDSLNTVTVPLGNRSYRIFIKPGILSECGHFIDELALSGKCVVITDTTVAPLYLETVKNSIGGRGFSVDHFVLPDGEEHKNLDQVASIYEKISHCSLDRSTPLVALGGGVIGDITGFAAATFLRGIPFIQIPTTLLAQVDSSVGGKTGVNLTAGKNLVGSFHQPSVVIIDPLVLNTLIDREYISGLAEVIKYAIIRDSTFFQRLQNSMGALLYRDPDALSDTIKTCCTIKAAITAADETESGIRAILNFGHTIGHTFETHFGYGTYTHGEAVSMGMAAAAGLSHIWHLCDTADVERVETILSAAGLPLAPKSFDPADLITTIMSDKKRSADTIRMVLLKTIGSVVLEKKSPDQILQGLGELYG